jgi:ribosomal-protein-alanine N-acetyltransferase
MVELNFDPFPVIETERLLLRKVSMDDAEDILKLRTNEAAMKYIKKPKLLSMDDAKELIKKMNEPDRIQWAITLHSADRIIGTIGYHKIDKNHYRAEIGYMLHPDHWNTGMMSEAITRVIDHGFNKMMLHSIEAIIDPENNISRKLLMKFGFIKEGYYKENFFFEGKFFDSEVYSLVKKP